MIAQYVDAGSSPLARGLRQRQSQVTVHGRIIPARAGFTLRLPHTFALRWDHPRSRGVYLIREHAIRLREGSSPLARGLLLCLIEEQPYSGSSPLARGLRDITRVIGADAGIIPARAGFTERCLSMSYVPTDHPRSRGVYNGRRLTAMTSGGSSPLARGLPVGRVPDYLLAWIIPARAGFTLTCVSASSTPMDHPRSRGVYGSACRRWGLASGSSPLARGLP